jgi:hypothetical protein
MNARINNGQRLPILVKGISYLGAITCIDGVWMVAVRGTTFKTGEIIVINDEEWRITRKNISTIRSIDSATMVKCG